MVELAPCDSAKRPEGPGMSGAWRAFTLVVAVVAGICAGDVMAQPPSPPPSCPTELVVRLNEARKKVQKGSYLAAKQDGFEVLLADPRFGDCHLRFQLSVYREYGDALTRLAAKKPGVQQTQYKKEAAEQYKAYLRFYAEADVVPELGPLTEQEFPRVVLNGCANMLFETGDYLSLCDLLADLSSRRPALFDAPAIEKWQKALLAANWAEPAKSARKQEFCALSSKAELQISRGARATFFGQC